MCYETSIESGTALQPAPGRLIWLAALMLAPLAAGAQAPQERPPPGEVVYRLQPGDSPWSISESYLLGMQFWPRIVRRNGFAGNATQLPPGTRVRIPQAWLRRRDVPVTVLATADEVVKTAPGGSRHAATAGTLLQAGDRLTTSNVGSATLRLDDGSRVLVRPATEFELTASNQPIQLPADTVEADPAPDAAGSTLEVQLRLLRGALENVVQRLNPAGRFEIDTPAAVAAVRGTELRVSVQDEQTLAELPQGGALLSTKGAALRLAAGEGTRTLTGRAPEPPSPLLPAPDLSSLPDEITRLPIELPLALITGAVGYRAQLVPVGELTPVSDLLTTGARLRLREPAGGSYLLRVRAVDARGLEGFAAERPIRVHTRPTPPLLIAPLTSAQFPDKQPLFRWSQAATGSANAHRAARTVRLQIAASADFAAPSFDRTGPDDGQAQPETALGIGTWYWRLQSIDPLLGPGPWSDVQTFQRILPAPGVAPPDVDADGLTLRWPQVPGAAGYHVQIARNSDFSDAVEDRTVTAEQIRLDRPAEGTYYLRVQAIAGDGVPGAFSETEQFQVEKPVNPWNLLWLLAPLLLAF